MRKGDSVLVYHSGAEKTIVGVAEITREAYPDPKAKDAKRQVVDVKFLRRFAFPVPLGVLKADKTFAEFELVRLPRLSVMPVPATLWKRIAKMAGES
jgi:predicted RNA-binding protein with PUA-like domain